MSLVGLALVWVSLKSLLILFIEHPHKLPSILITGAEGKRTHARALINSLCIEKIKNCPSRYFDAGISSKQFFHDSSPNSAYIIENIHEIMRTGSEAVLWQYLKLGFCAYWSPIDNNSDFIYCNGLTILTASDRVPPTIKDAIDYKVHIEPYSVPQIEKILKQRLQLLGVEYDAKVIKMLAAHENVRTAIDELKKSLLSLHASGGTKLITNHVANPAISKIC